MTQLIVLLIGITSALGFFAISVGVCLLEKYPKASQTVALEKTQGVPEAEDQWASSQPYVKITAIPKRLASKQREMAVR